MTYVGEGKHNLAIECIIKSKDIIEKCKGSRINTLTLNGNIGTLYYGMG